MISQRDIESLVSQWDARLHNESYEASYKDALGECIYELNQLLEKSILEEADSMDFLEREFLEHLPSEEAAQYLLEQEADYYLSSMEAHDYVS